ncbi:Uncharacterized protein FKW44_009941, partial [Caligus rogercresseyi]
VNDVAERAVKLGSDFTKVLTKSEKQRQNILQDVELSRRAFLKQPESVSIVSHYHLWDELM